MVTADTFIRLAKAIIGRVQEHTTLDHEFRALFGVSPTVCVDMWQRSNMGEYLEPKHLLWGLLFLKVYTTETPLCALVGVTRKTYRKWVWEAVRRMSEVYPQVVSCSCLLDCFCYRQLTTWSVVVIYTVLYHVVVVTCGQSWPGMYILGHVRLVVLSPKFRPR